MQRREFLAVTGGTATVALAGCLGGGDGDDSTDNGDDEDSTDDSSAGDDAANGSDDGDTADDSDDGDSVPDYNTDEAIATLREYINAGDLETARGLLHSNSTAEPSTVGEVIEEEYAVLEENIGRERLATLAASDDLTAEDFDAIAEGVVVVLEADVVFEYAGSETSTVSDWLVATENGEWRVVERATDIE